MIFLSSHEGPWEKLYCSICELEHTYKVLMKCLHREILNRVDLELNSWTSNRKLQLKSFYERDPLLFLELILNLRSLTVKLVIPTRQKDVASKYFLRPNHRKNLTSLQRYKKTSYCSFKTARLLFSVHYGSHMVYGRETLKVSSLQSTSEGRRKVWKYEGGEK